MTARAASSVGTATSVGRKAAIWDASRRGCPEPAANAHTWNRSRCAAITWRACVPIDPVDPRSATRRFRTGLLSTKGLKLAS
jgi:hypothetical protein